MGGRGSKTRGADCVMALRSPGHWGGGDSAMVDNSESDEGTSGGLSKELHDSMFTG